jgi:hypothetical protein
MIIISMAYQPKEVIEYLNQKYIGGYKYVCRNYEYKNNQDIKLYLTKSRAEMVKFTRGLIQTCTPIVLVEQAISNHYISLDIPQYENLQNRTKTKEEA